MIALPLAHVAGIPIEETLVPLAPALLLALGAVSALLRTRLRRGRPVASDDARTQADGRERAWGGPG